MLAAHALDGVTHWLSQVQRPLLLTHRRPDGDALGSVLGLFRALTQLGATPYVVLYEPLPRRYRFWADAADWRIWDEQREGLSRECDSVIIVDTCALAQLEPVVDLLRQAPPILVVDHHATHDAIGQRQDDLRLLDETAGATCLMLAEWARHAGVRFDPLTATAFFTGIATDTGWFRFSNTDDRALRVAAGLVSDGANPNELYTLLHEQEPLEKLRLIASMLGRMELLAGGRLAILKLRPADFANAGADESMTEDLVNEASRLAGVEATVLFTEETGNLVRVNFRSKGGLDVAEMARRFGGGGHARAAGARVVGSWDQVVPRITRDLLEVL